MLTFLRPTIYEQKQHFNYVCLIYAISPGGRAVGEEKQRPSGFGLKCFPPKHVPVEVPLKLPPPSHGWHGAKICVCVEQQLVHTQRQCFFFNAVCIFPPCFSFESVQGIDFRSECFTFASKMNKLTDGGRADFSFPMFAAVLCCNTISNTTAQHTAIGLALLWLWLRRQMSARGESKGASFTLLIGGKHSHTANLITYANSGSDLLKLRRFLQEENGRIIKD